MLCSDLYASLDVCYTHTIQSRLKSLRPSGPAALWGERACVRTGGAVDTSGASIYAADNQNRPSHSLNPPTTEPPRLGATGWWEANPEGVPVFPWHVPSSPCEEDRHLRKQCRVRQLVEGVRRRTGRGSQGSRWPGAGPPPRPARRAGRRDGLIGD